MNYADLVLGADTSGLLNAQRDLKGVRDEGARTEQGITGSMGKVSKGFAGAATAAARFAAGAAAAAASTISIGAAVGVISQFEGSMSQVAAITGATGAELAALRDIAKELGSTTEFSAAQAADSLRFLGMAGFSAAESMKAIPAVLDLATASSMGLAESADIASNVLSGFGLAADDAAQVADVLAAASSRANTSVSQLGDAMSTVAPISAALGIDLADTAAAIGVLSDAGIQGERAGTALRGALASLAGPTSQAQEALAQYGITAAQVNPETQSLTEIFGLLRERGLSTADAMTIFGREAASGALVLAEASGRVGEFGEELRGAEGAAADMAGIMRDNLGGAANTLMSSVQGLAIALGEAGLTAVLIAGLGAVTAMVRGLTRLVEIGGSVIEWVTSFGTFEATMRNVQAATDTTNLAIADTLAQVNALSVAEMGGRKVSLDYASAKLEQARASYAAAEAMQQENIERVKASEEYQDLIARQMRLNETISMLQDILSESPSQAALDMMEFMRDPTDPNNLDGFVVQLERSLEKLRETVAQQELMTSATGETTAEMEAALRQIELYEAAIAAAKGETVILGAETSNAADTTAALARLSGQVDFGNAVSSAQSLADWLGISLSRAMALAATTPAMADEDLLMSQGVIPDANARAAQREAVENFERMSAAMNRVGGSARSAGKAVSDAEKEVEKLNDEISRLEDAADPTRKFRREMEQLDTLLENGLSDGAYAQAVRELNEELVESTPILSSVNDAFGQMVDYMFDGFKDGMRGILDIFVNTLKQMAATALKNRITIGLGLGVTGGAGAAAAGVPGVGGSNILGQIGQITGIGSAFMGGMSNVIGATFGAGGSFAMGLQSIGAQVSAAIAGPTLTSVSAALGAVALPVAAVVGAILAFKKTTVTVAEGVRAEIDGATLALDSYVKTKENNGLGMSSGFDREFTRLDEAVQSAVGARLNATVDALGAFGLNTNLDGFQFSKRTEIKEGETFEGESEEVIREALNAAVEYLAEGALEVYQLAGEGLSDTLTRLSTAIQVVNPLVDRLGNHMLDMSLDGAAAASALIEAAGGLEAFAAETAFVFENFTLDAEKAHIAADELGIQMRALGVDTIPATHAAFMELVNAQDLATEGGREMYAALLDIAPLFVQVKGTAQEAADAALNQANANDELTNTSNDAAAAARELAAQQREQQSLLLQIARMTGNVAYIREQELAALNEANRPLQEYIYLLEDQADALDTALATARQALTDAEGAFDSAVNTLRALAQNAQDQLDAAEDAARRAFDAQKDLVRANFDAQINDVRTAADAQIEAALATVDALNAEREAAAERAASQAITVREQISLLEGILGSLDSALDNRRALTPEGRAMELAQAQAFLRSSVAAGGVTDPDALEQALAIVADPSTDLFNSFEDYAYDFKVNTGYIQRLRDLTDDALTVEEKTLQALEGQIEAIEAQIEAARTNTEAQIEAIEANATATVEGLEQALAAELGKLDEAFNDLMGIDDSILSVSEATQAVADAQELVAAANSALAVATGDAAVATGALTASLGSVATALEAALAAMQAVDDAQDVVDQVTGGGTGGSGGSGGGSSIPDFGPSSAGKRLLGILEGIDGASGVAALTEQAAFSAFSADRMNAILSDVGVAALSGSAAAAAQAFKDALGRNIDVAGLGFYTGVIDAQTDALGDLDAAMEFVRKDVQTNGDQFEYAIQQMAQRLGPPIDATADAALHAAVKDGEFHTANIGQLVAIENGIFTLGSQIEALAAAAVERAAAPVAIAPTGVSTASQLVNEALAGAANAAVGSVEESFYLAAAAEWTRRGGIPSYANGTDYHPGGWARLHENEMVNLPRGTSVSTAGETRAMAESNMRIAQQTEQNAAELRQIRRFLQSLADIEEERRAEELAAGA